MKLRTFWVAVSCLGAVLAGQADDVWQWSVPLGAGRAFLWIPPDCPQVRAVVVGQNNMIEEGILQHEYFRRQMAKLGIAEIFIAPPFDTWQSATNNGAANEKFNAMLKSLATDSGYAELEFAPIIPIGHSALASFPWNFAAWNPQRTLAILSVHGDAPQTPLTGNGRPNLDWGTRSIDGIPGLMVMGEYEWWEDRLTPATKFRAEHPGQPIALLCDAGHGHFDYSDELVKFLALFIQKSVKARLPDGVPDNEPVKLKPVNARDGWLVDRWHPNEKPPAKAAPFVKYTGDTNTAFWCFDREMARATENFNPQRGRQPQLVGFVQDGKIVDQTPNTHEQIRIKVPPLDDALMFTLTGAFLDVVPAGENPAKWTGLTNGAVLPGHATGGGPVKLSRITGPVEQLAADIFAVRFNRATVSVDRRMGDIWLLAKQPGDGQFKSALQQALLKIPVQLKDGAAQHLTFPQPADVQAGVTEVKLSAASDAGVPVYYYVREGPAWIDGSVLRITKIPARAKFPVKITVVAWQYGRNIEPKLKSAEPVEQTFCIHK